MRIDRGFSDWSGRAPCFWICSQVSECVLASMLHVNERMELKSESIAYSDRVLDVCQPATLLTVDRLKQENKSLPVVSCSPCTSGSVSVMTKGTIKPATPSRLGLINKPAHENARLSLAVQEFEPRKQITSFHHGRGSFDGVVCTRSWSQTQNDSEIASWMAKRRRRDCGRQGHDCAFNHSIRWKGEASFALRMQLDVVVEEWNVNIKLSGKEIDENWNSCFFEHTKRKAQSGGCGKNNAVDGNRCQLP